jgi:hypothetical protein
MPNRVVMDNDSLHLWRSIIATVKPYNCNKYVLLADLKQAKKSPSLGGAFEVLQAINLECKL